MPSGSEDPVPSTATSRWVAVEVKAATGTWLGGGSVATTSTVVAPVAPSSSETVRVTG